MAIQTFTAAQVLTAAQMNALQANDYNQTVSAKVASYTLVAADKGTRITMSNAAATTITVNTSLFAAGDSLRIQNIGAGVCTVTAGTATVTSAGPLAVAQWGGGQLFFTSTSAAIWFPDAQTSKFGQLVSTTKSDTFSTASTSYTDVTGMSVSITPSLNTSKVFVVCNINYANAGSGFVQLMRGSTAISIGDASGTRTRSSGGGQTAVTAFNTISIAYLDSPATTSSTTYKMQVRTESGTVYINSTTNQDNAPYSGTAASNITVMEILA